MEGETKRLYFDDPYTVKFEANIIEKIPYDGGWALVLDQTCFYPESGGQPSDRGILNGITVINVVEENGKILHVLKQQMDSKKVCGQIDFEVRFDHMQQHAGQHILSQSFFEFFKAETLSFHIGGDVSTVEIDIRKASEEDVEKIEKLANQIVFQNREIKTYFVSGDEIQRIPLRKPPKKKGPIRVVEVSDFDFSACGGTHPYRTGEVGLIKVLKWERIRNNVRFEFVCGNRALNDYISKNRQIRLISVRFNVNDYEVVSSVEKLFLEFKGQKKKIKKMQVQMIQYEAQEITSNAKEVVIKNIFQEKTPEELRFLALNIIRNGEFVVIFGLKKETRVHLVLACAESVGLDMRELIPFICPLIKGKGGGSSSLVELSGEEKENLEMALDRACEFIQNKL